ncbi:hypothetical protein AGLY_010683 [Aphis glycines]|uniref:Uncharacterized protein n=1 Tax=Aphis glycines TaxID=307491 RepID=A0A6G0TGG1_APHGL|nr:hypothetical protein AGLY_010683 [Aphis glycines]
MMISHYGFLMIAFGVFLGYNCTSFIIAELSKTAIIFLAVTTAISVLVSMEELPIVTETIMKSLCSTSSSIVPSAIDIPMLPHPTIPTTEFLILLPHIQKIAWFASKNRLAVAINNPIVVSAITSDEIFDVCPKLMRIDDSAIQVEDNRKLSTDVDKDHVDFSFRRFYDHFWHMSGVVITGRGRKHSGDAKLQTVNSRIH